MEEAKKSVIRCSRKKVRTATRSGMNVNMCRNESVQTSRPYLHARKQRNGTWSKRHTAGSECECAGVGRTARCACVVVREKKDFINKRTYEAKSSKKAATVQKLHMRHIGPFALTFSTGAWSQRSSERSSVLSDGTW